MKHFLAAALLFNALFLASSSSHAEGFSLSSPDIMGQLSIAQVFNGFGCSGDNISPLLNWKDAPKGTKSFAVTAYDPDAPTGSGWWHWVVFDIPGTVSTLGRDAGNIKMSIAPKASIQSVTSFGQRGFGGACPPPGDTPHQYIFTVYALKVDTLGLDSKTMPAMVGFNISSNMLAKASVVAYYGR